MGNDHRSVTRQRLLTPGGTTLSYSTYGSGPSLVLVHGSFSDDETNWEFVKPMLEERFAVFAIARRGRGDTDATEGHGLEDEASDLVALIEAVGEPVYLLGHSHGAHCALAAADRLPGRVRKLVLYEPIWPQVPGDALARLEPLAAAGDWEQLAVVFFRDTLLVPAAEIDAVRASDLWPPILADARASFEDIRAISRYRFDAGGFARVRMPVLLQIGSESPRHLYVTDALAKALPDAHIDVLEGQAHEGMTTAPAQYAAAVTGFLLGMPA